MSLIVLYFLHSTSVLSFYIDVVLPLSIRYFTVLTAQHAMTLKGFAHFWPFVRILLRSLADSHHKWPLLCGKKIGVFVAGLNKFFNEQWSSYDIHMKGISVKICKHIIELLSVLLLFVSHCLKDWQFRHDRVITTTQATLHALRRS